MKNFRKVFEIFHEIQIGIFSLNSILLGESKICIACGFLFVSFFIKVENTEFNKIRIM